MDSGALPTTSMDRGALPTTSMDLHLLSFPTVVPERLEIKSEKEEPNAEDHVTSIKREIDSFPVGGFPVIVPETLEIKSEREEPNTEAHLTTIKSEIDSFSVDGANHNILWGKQRLSCYK
ncbi:hypothetical protein FKM82_025791 [Ascaphus truei]